MNKESFNNNQLYGLLPTDCEGMETLTELALDLRWSWNHCTDELWRKLDPALWASTRHPSVVLQTIAREKLAAALADPEFCRVDIFGTLIFK